MKMLKNLLLGSALSGLSTLVLAAGNPLSVHVLNLQDGLPSPGVEVSLEKLDGERWNKLNEGTTNEQGRITALYPEGKKLESGTYRVTFETGAWFKQHAGPAEGYQTRINRALREYVARRARKQRRARAA